jgi:hypothetical protein
MGSDVVSGEGLDGGVTTMTLNDTLNDGLSSGRSVCSVWVARLAGVLGVLLVFVRFSPKNSALSS